MKKLAIIIVLMYAFILIALTWPILLACFYPIDPSEVFKIWSYWVFLIIMLFCQTGLLLIPVRIENKRPITKRAIYLPLIISGFLIGCLLFGVICAIAEFLTKDLPFEAWQGWTVIGICVLVWIFWTVLFYRLTQGKKPQDIIASQCRKLLSSSVISLLVAVPAHIVARHRNYCCAGFYTFIGIVFGIAVMLISFGPSVFFLYVNRWRHLHPEKFREINLNNEDLK